MFTIYRGHFAYSSTRGLATTPRRFVSGSIFASFRPVHRLAHLAKSYPVHTNLVFFTMGDTDMRNTAALLCITPDSRVLVERVDPNRSETLPNSCTLPLLTKRPEDADFNWSAMLKAIEAEAFHEPVSALLFALPTRSFFDQTILASQTTVGKPFNMFKICFLYRYDGHGEQANAPLTLRDGKYALPFMHDDAPPCLTSSCHVAWTIAFNSVLPDPPTPWKTQTAIGFALGIRTMLEFGLEASSPAVTASEGEIVKASTIRFSASGTTVRFDKFRKDASDTSLPLATVVGKMITAPCTLFADETLWTKLAQTCEAGTQDQVPIGPTLLGRYVCITDVQCRQLPDAHTPYFNDLLHQYFTMRWVGANLDETEVREIGDDALKDFFRRYRAFNLRAASHFDNRFERCRDFNRALDIVDIRTLLNTIDYAITSARETVEKNLYGLSPRWQDLVNDMQGARNRISRRALAKRADALERLEDLKAPRRYVACHGELHTGNVTFLSPTSARTAEKRLYAVDWSDAYLGPWFLESIPFAQHFDTDEDGARSQEILNMFLESVGDQLHPGLSLQDATAIFDLARPFRYFRRCIMALRRFEYPPALDITLSTRQADGPGPSLAMSHECPQTENLLLACTTYLNKAAGALLSNEFCRNEDAKWEDCNDRPPMADLPPQFPGYSEWDDGNDSQSDDNDGDDDDNDDMDIP